MNIPKSNKIAQGLLALCLAAILTPVQANTVNGAAADCVDDLAGYINVSNRVIPQPCNEVVPCATEALNLYAEPQSQQSRQAGLPQAAVVAQCSPAVPPLPCNSAASCKSYACAWAPCDPVQTPCGGDDLNYALLGSDCIAPCEDSTGYVIAGEPVCFRIREYNVQQFIDEVCGLLSERARALAYLCTADGTICGEEADQADTSCLFDYELVGQVQQMVMDQVDGVAEGNASAAGAFSLGCYVSPLTAVVPGYMGFGCAGAAAFAAGANFEKTFLWKEWDFHVSASGSGCGGGVGGTVGVTPAVSCQGVSTSDGSAHFGCQVTDDALLEIYAAVCSGYGVAVSDEDCAESDAAAHASNMPALKESTDASASAVSAGCGSLLTGASRNAQVFSAEELPPDVIPALKDRLVDALYAAYEPQLAAAPPLVQAIGLLNIGGIEQGIMKMDVDHVLAVPLE